MISSEAAINMRRLQLKLGLLKTLKRIRKGNFIIMPLCILLQWFTPFQGEFSAWRILLPTIVTVGLIIVWIQSHRRLTKQIQDKTLDIVRRRLAGEL